MGIQLEDYDRFIAPVRERMIASAWRIVRDPDLTDEVVQTALVRVLKKMSRIRHHPNPTAFILRVCVGCAIDELRRSRKQRRSVERLTDDVLDHNAELPESGTVRQETAMEITAAIAQLPRRQAEAILLLAVEELSYDKIAAAMGCPRVDRSRPGVPGPGAPPRSARGSARRSALPVSS